MDMIKRDSVNYDEVSNNVRLFCAERYYELEKALRPLIDGSFGEQQPGHLAAYLACVRQLGKLYQAENPPRDLEQTIPASKVQQILAGIREQHELEMAAAVAEAEARIRAELTLGTRKSVTAAKETVSSRLLELESRAASQG